MCVFFWSLLLRDKLLSINYRQSVAQLVTPGSLPTYLPPLLSSIHHDGAGGGGGSAAQGACRMCIPEYLAFYVGLQLTVCV